VFDNGNNNNNNNDDDANGDGEKGMSQRETFTWQKLSVAQKLEKERNTLTY
jgi:catabolite regulation protein CreA